MSIKINGSFKPSVYNIPEVFEKTWDPHGSKGRMHPEQILFISVILFYLLNHSSEKFTREQKKGSHTHKKTTQSHVWRVTVIGRQGEELATYSQIVKLGTPQSQRQQDWHVHAWAQWSPGNHPDMQEKSQPDTEHFRAGELMMTSTRGRANLIILVVIWLLFYENVILITPK